MTSVIRCAIYTRKSSEEGLEQSFNSLHAQREACEAYVTSQRHEGWQALSTAYDDGGFSGGNTDRPGLKQLLADIHAGKIDTVVVYKVDRLTRSLADFAKIVELFDSKQVSFVSVTQQFNTTTSMGRLTLNVLLSFAQFEREVTGERIRDKVAASKAKGMWMGGTVPLGYDLLDRKLHINPDEAERVREIYREYLRIGSVSGLKEYLDRRSTISKLRILKGGKKSGGAKFFRGALYRLLNNRLYAGEVAHNDNVYKGEHEAIIDREQWLAVQQLIAENRQGPKRRRRVTKNSLLTGILFDDEGNRLTPTHANKAGKRYRYYTSQSIIRKTGSQSSMTRIPAHELEQTVLGRIEAFLRSDDDLLVVARSLNLLGRSLESFFQSARKLAEYWNGFSSEDKEERAKLTLVKVVVLTNQIELSLTISNLLDWPRRGERVGVSDSDLLPATPLQVITLTCPFSQVRRGQELRLIIDGADPLLNHSTTSLLKAISRARLWYEQIVSGDVGSIPELAQRHSVTPRYVKKIFRCALLGPDVVEAILAGKCSPDLTLDSLTNKLYLEWFRQRKSLLPVLSR
jgi:site-specific DNA recombinase